MAVPVQVTTNDWVQLAPVGFASIIVQPRGDVKMWLEFAPAKPTAPEAGVTVGGRGAVSDAGQLPYTTENGANAAWGRSNGSSAFLCNVLY